MFLFHPPMRILIFLWIYNKIMIHYFLYYIILCSLVLTQNTQKFIYKTKFKSFQVGTTEITIQTNKSNKQQTIITIESFSNKWIDLIYKLRHHSTLIVNSYDYSLLATTQKVQQGDYLDSYNATINYDEKRIYYKNLISNQMETDETIIPIEGKVYDPFSIVYYLQNQVLDTNQQHIFTYYSKKNIQSLKLKLEIAEEIVTPYITSSCYLVVPYSTNNEYLLKNKGEMKIWYTADANQFPIKIQQKMRHGIMELLLVEYIEK